VGQARIRMLADGVLGAGGWAEVLRSSGRMGSRGEHEAAHWRINMLLKFTPQLCVFCELCGEKRHKYITFLILNYWRRCFRYDAANLRS